MSSTNNKVRNIRDWLQRYGKFSAKLFHSNRTLEHRQSSGGQQDIELQSTKLQSVEQQYVEEENYFEKTGFICRSVLWNRKSEIFSESKEDSTYDGEPLPIIGKYTFLSDWERLWNYFAEEGSGDEVAVQLPFLRAAMELIFHPRMVQVVYIVFVWNLTIIVTLQQIYSTHLSAAVFDTFYLNILFELFVYLFICAMMKGPSAARFFQTMKHHQNKHQSTNTSSAAGEINSLSSSADNTATTLAVNNTIHNIGNIELEEREVAQEAIDQEFPFWDTFRRTWRRGKLEIHSLLSENISNKSNQYNHNNSHDNALKTRESDQRPILFYYDWINIALKVLTRDYKIDLQQINFNRRSYRFMLLFTFTVYPIYVICMFYYKVITLMNEFCSDLNYDRSACNFYYTEFISSLFGVTIMLGQYLFGASVLLSLVGLAYGGEIAFRLAESWTQKFHSLRRIEMNQNTAAAAAENEDQEEETPLSTKKNRRDMKKADSDDDDTDNNINNDANSKANNSTGYNAEDDEADETTSINIFLPKHTTHLTEAIDRDATEHYLFICALFRRASELWSPLLLIFMFVTAYDILASVIVLLELLATTVSFQSGFWIASVILYVCIRFLILVVYPVLSIAFANSYFINTYDLFRIADGLDYPIIGGRDRWNSMFSESPATWTFFGVAIIPERLLALLWTALVAMAGIFFTSLISSNSV